MNYSEVHKALKAAGSEQTRKTYARHGVERKMYGVSYAVLNDLKKKIKVDHAMAEKLWATGVHDCMILACFVADPQKMDIKTINAWEQAAGNHIENGAFSTLVAQTPHGFKKANQWLKSKQERTASLGWSVLGQLALNGYDADWAPYIDQIEQQIHAAQNRVKYSMNGALISMGVVNAACKKQALAAAKRIGTVEVDHGDTACKTPAAGPYIEKTWAHKNRKKKTS